MEPDYILYTIMEIERTASSTDIETAYKKLAVQLHPDKAAFIIKKHFPNLEKFSKAKFDLKVQEQKKEMELLFSNLLEAYEILSDPEKRKYYDKHGKPPATQPTIESYAKENFRNLLKKVVDSNASPATENIVKIMSNILHREKHSINSQKEELLQKAKKITQVKKRLSGPPAGIHTGIIRDEYKAIRASVKSIKKHLAVLAAVEKIVEDYSYKTDSPEYSMTITGWPGFQETHAFQRL